MSASQNKQKRIFFFLLRLAITATIFAYLFKKIDFHSLTSQMLHANMFYIILGAAFAILSYTLVSLRWRLVIKALNNDTLTKKQCFKLVLISMFFNQFMLASVGGDAIRIWLATRYQLTPRIAINSTLFDRLFGLIMLAILIAACLPIYAQVLPDKVTFISLSLLITAIGIGMLLLLCLDRLPLLSRIRLFQSTFGNLSHDARTLFLSAKKAYKPAAYAAISIMIPSLIVYLIAQAYHLPVSLMHCLAIIPPVMLISMMPISIAGWGVREGSMMVAATYLGITTEQALLLSLWLGITLLIASLPGALLWLSDKYSSQYKLA